MVWAIGNAITESVWPLSSWDRRQFATRSDGLAQEPGVAERDVRDTGRALEVVRVVSPAFLRDLDSRLAQEVALLRLLLLHQLRQRFASTL